MAIISRIFLVLFAGHTSVGRTVASEAVCEKSQSRAFGYLGGWSQMGSVLPLAIWGWFSFVPSSDSKKDLAILGRCFFFEFSNATLRLLGLHIDEYPFLMPNLIGAALSLATFFIGYLYLPETRERTTPDMISPTYGLPSSENGRRKSQKQYQEIPITSHINPEEEDLDLSTTLSHGSDDIEIQFQPESLSKRNMCIKIICQIDWKRYLFPCFGISHLLSDQMKRLAIALYVYYALIHMFYSEMTPLWLLSSKSNEGFGLNTNQVGTILSASAFGLFIYVTFIFPLFSHLIKPTRLLLNGVTMLGLLFILLPISAETAKLWFIPSFLDEFVKSHIMGVLIVLQILWHCLNSSCFVPINVVINNAAFQEERGAMNGLVMMFGSLSKGIGPISGAEMFAWSINHDYGWPFDFHLPFYFLASLCFVLTYLSLILPDELNVKKK